MFSHGPSILGQTSPWSHSASRIKTPLLGVRVRSLTDICNDMFIDFPTGVSSSLKRNHIYNRVHIPSYLLKQSSFEKGMVWLSMVFWISSPLNMNFLWQWYMMLVSIVFLAEGHHLYHIRRWRWSKISRSPKRRRVRGPTAILGS